MCLIIVLAVLRTSPKLSVRHTARISAEGAIIGKTRNDLEEVDRRIVACGLCTRITEETLVVELLHVLHGLLWRDA